MSIGSYVKKTAGKSLFLSRIVSDVSGNWYYNRYKTDNDKVLEKFVPREKREDASYMKALKKDLLLAKLRHGAEVEEYFRYGFEKLSDAGRQEYLLVENSDRYFRAVEASGARKLFRDKFLAYQKFGDYYKRELIAIRSDDDFPAFESFVQRHPSYIVKPLAEYGGHGIFKDSVESGTVQEKFSSYRSSLGECAVEELVIQDERMARFHPQSVNTLRIVTYCKDHEIHILQSSVRIGVGASVVDNGCLSAGIDYETGTIITRGRMAHVAGLYVFHPDTGIQILGNHIPEWDQVKDLINRLPYVVEEQPVVGWDLALSEKGWVVIEANTRPEVQILSGEGIGMRNIVERNLGIK